MKQISQNYKSGAIRLENLPPPSPRAGTVLVRTHYSVVSAGTEGMKVKEGKMSYLGKARARPDQVRKLLNSLRQHGLRATYQKVNNKLDKLTPLGYSLSGEVIAVGAGAEEFHLGQRVSCAGAGYANHADINVVPKNLAVAVPAGVAMKHAAFATVGAIALQGFRQARMQLGETACVIGLGLLGQLLVQILRAAGVHVVGVDVLERRCELAVRCGAFAAFGPADIELAETVARLTGGHGVDAVFITAGAAGNGPIDLAVDLARDRARIVDIGKTKLDLPWNDGYMKELDFRFSRSYGPGRYDPNYEERGVDYPIGYVRWTERRNMAAFLDLLATGRVQLELLTPALRPFEEAEQVYEEMAQGRLDSLATILEYAPEKDVLERAPVLTQSKCAQKPVRAQDVVRLGVIGAGNYALSMLLPALQANKAVLLHTVATASALSGLDAARKCGFQQATTNYREMLDNPNIDAVLIATRHATHARITADALLAGKAVYVEKPLALNLEELRLLRETIKASGNDRLMVGFNRRFAPIFADISARLRRHTGPLTMQYRVHAGQLDAGSWYLGREEGSRFVGEGGHFIDLISFISGSRPVSVYARALRPEKLTSDDLNNLSIIVQLEDGSVANLLYLTQGGARTPKEYLEVVGGGQTVQMHNFERVIRYEASGLARTRWRQNKGQREALSAYIECVRAGLPMPISTEALFDTTLATLAVGGSAQSGAVVQLSELYEGLLAEEQPSQRTTENK